MIPAREVNVAEGRALLASDAKDGVANAADVRCALNSWLRNNAAALLDAAEQNKALREALVECEDYFDQRADADVVGDPQQYVGNAEMTMLGIVRQALGD